LALLASVVFRLGSLVSAYEEHDLFSAKWPELFEHLGNEIFLPHLPHQGLGEYVLPNHVVANCG
jgi:hypothetical protein